MTLSRVGSMDSAEIREKFIKFFEEKGHKKMAPSSLIPAESDSSVLFTTAGMQQFKRFYLNPQVAPDKNVVTIQPCVRTSDIEEVGDATHLTFFEMLGNFSFGYPDKAGSYFKKEAIEMAWKFLTDKKWLGVDPSRISASYFDQDKAKKGIAITIDTDIESLNILKNLEKKGLKKIEGGGEDNFWSLGTVGSPGGPTVEFYVDGIEVWNLVFNEMIFKDKPHEHWYSPGINKGVDTGMGLERLAAIMQGKKDIFETDLFLPIIKKIEELTGKKYEEHLKEFRIITDHIRTVIFLLAQGLEPSNLGRGYVLRRLIRKAYLSGQKILILRQDLMHIPEGEAVKHKGPFLKYIAEKAVEIMVEPFPKLKNINFKILINEEEKFQDIIDRAAGKIWKQKMEIRSRITVGFKGEKFRISEISGKELFDWYQKDGIPLEISLDEARRLGIPIKNGAVEQFERLFREHQEKSRTASAGMFKGGLADDSEQTTKLHTAAHLLLAALRQILGGEIKQAGSNINQERLRFDFTYPEKVSEDKLKQIEDLVNQKIGENLSVTMQEMPLDEAKSSGATGVFDERYGEKVKVYSIGDFSKEICGGPHVENTSSLGHFKIIKEESSSAGVRRIKAVLELN